MTEELRVDAGRAPEPASVEDPRVTSFRLLLGVVDRLRAPDGCPWDLEQTLETMAPHAVEEAHELAEAIENGEDKNISTEAGDLLLNVLLVARIAEQDARFSLKEVCDLEAAKLIRRHPHVFSTSEADSSEEVLARWEEIKRAEREAAEEDASALAGVPKTLPGLQRAMRISAKAVAAGFRWRDVRGALSKLQEEQGELTEALPDSALESVGVPELEDQAWSGIDHELGDVLMAGAFLASYLGRDPELLCKRALQRFETRFRGMEQELGGDLHRDLDELEAVWRSIKAREQ